MLEQDKVERIKSRNVYFLFLFFFNSFLFMCFVLLFFSLYKFVGGKKKKLKNSLAKWQICTAKCPAVISKLKMHSMIINTNVYVH